MSRLPTSLVGAAHDYTRADTPWILEEHQSIYGKLIHYLSGGGMRTFGRTIAQEVARRKHRRFLLVSAAIGLVWSCFYFL